MNAQRPACPKCGTRVPVKARSKGSEVAQRTHAVKDHMRSRQCTGGAKKTKHR